MIKRSKGVFNIGNLTKWDACIAIEGEIVRNN